MNVKNYITKNSIYTVQGGVVVGVQNMRGEVIESHRALGLKLMSGMRLYPNGAAVPTNSEPEPGDAMYLMHGQEQLLTSAIQAAQ